MAELKITSTDYSELDAYLGTKDARVIGHNTLLRRTWSGDELAVQLHGTDVVTVRPNGEVILRTGGWWTPTTADRINRFLRPKGYLFHSDRKHGRVVRTPDGTLLPFEEGMTLTMDRALV